MKIFAFLLLLTFSDECISQIVFTDVNPDVVTTMASPPGGGGNVHPIDLNSDGIEDYNFRWDEFPFGGGWFMHLTFEMFNSQIGLKGTATNPFGGRFIKPLSLNESVDVNLLWGVSFPEPFIGESTTDQNFLGLGDRYIPVRFRTTAGSDYYYGWILVRFETSGTTRRLIIKSYAYNSLLNQPIFAGQTTNAKPIAQDDNYTILKNVVSNFEVLQNDSDPNVIDTIKLSSIILSPRNGAVTMNTTQGRIAYTPNNNYIGKDSFDYSIVDFNGVRDTARVYITVNNTTAQNRKPVAQDDNYTILKNAVSNFEVLQNDSDPDANDTIKLSNIIVSPRNGVVTMNTTQGRIAYTPNNNYIGNDSFDYSITDLSGLKDTARVYITVNNTTTQNRKPIALDDNYTILKNAVSNFEVLQNDSDPDANDTIKLSNIIVSPRNGVVTMNTTQGRIAYTPSNNYIGKDSFDYSITDLSGLKDTARVYITVNNTTTQNRKPVAQDDNYTILKNAVSNFEVLQNDSDPDANDTIKLSNIIVSPRNGVVTMNTTQGRIAYTPNNNYIGKDSFDYSITDLSGLKDTARVYITVNNTTTQNRKPVAQDDNYTILKNAVSNFEVLKNDSDPDANDAIKLSNIIVSPRNGVVTMNTTQGRIAYTPSNNYIGKDSFDYSITDLSGLKDTARVYITVNNTTTQNRKPVAKDDNYTILKNAVSNFEVLKNDSDPDANDTIKLSNIIVSPRNGVVTMNTTQGRIAYTPSNNYIGKDSFDYSITDLSGLKDTARVYVDVQNKANISDIDLSKFLVYPNPTKNVLKIDLQEYTKNLNYTLLDVLGMKVKEGVITQKSSVVDISELSKGTYFLFIQENDFKYDMQKVIKE